MEPPEILGTGDLEFPRGVDGEQDNNELSDSVKLSSSSRLCMGGDEKPARLIGLMLLEFKFSVLDMNKKRCNGFKIFRARDQYGKS